MQPQDSYTALVDSIERALRTETAAPRRDVPDFGSVDDMLTAEACAGERKLAYLRVAVALGTVGLAAWALGVDGVVTPGRLCLSLSLPMVWGLVAIGLAAKLARGWYDQRVRYGAPAFDGLVVFGVMVMLSDMRASVVAPMHIVGLEVALCGFLAMSGALRLSRGSAQISAALALALFAFAALADHLSPYATIALGSALLAVGILSIEVTSLVRRVAVNEVKRLVFARMYAQAQEAVHAREEVLKVVSHDLRNPLNTIAMCASFMLDAPMPENERAKHLGIIRRAVDRMNRLIQDLLDVARLEARRLSINPVALSVDAVLAEAEETLRPLAAERSLTLKVESPPERPRITADSGRVLQVLSNLVGNAIKFTPAHGQITIRAERVERAVVFSVSDTGAGIPPAQLDRIFGRFWQGDPNDRRGIGLGLAISKGIVEAHNGRIWVESKVDVGTTFYFTIPTEPAAGELPVAPIERRASSPITQH